jgi:hypothetical protein
MGDAATPVYAAAQNDHLAMVRPLASLGANVNAPMKDGGTPVYVAATWRW